MVTLTSAPNRVAFTLIFSNEKGYVVEKTLNFTKCYFVLKFVLLILNEFNLVLLRSTYMLLPSENVHCSLPYGNGSTILKCSRILLLIMDFFCWHSLGMR